MTNRALLGLGVVLILACSWLLDQTWLHGEVDNPPAQDIAPVCDGSPVGSVAATLPTSSQMYSDASNGVSFEFPNSLATQGDPAVWTASLVDRHGADSWINYCGSSCMHITQNSIAEYRSHFELTSPEIPISPIRGKGELYFVREAYNVADGRLGATCKIASDINANATYDCTPENGVNYVFWSQKTGFFDLWINVSLTAENAVISSLRISDQS